MKIYKDSFCLKIFFKHPINTFKTMTELVVQHHVHITIIIRN